VHATRDTIAVFDPSGLIDEPKAKVAAGLLSEWGQRSPVLVVLTDEQARAALAFRNLERVSVLPAQDIGVADLIGAAAVLASQEALDALTLRVNNGKEAA
jgi:large subunit ribosomal protein L4